MPSDFSQQWLQTPENTWGKFEYVHRGLNGENITVHFWRNLLDGIETGFKVK
jgi:hypothetical protein